MKNNTDQGILFRATRKINIIDYDTSFDTSTFVFDGITDFKPNYLAALTLNKEISRYGYTFSLKALEEIGLLSNEDLKQLKEQMITLLEEATGYSDFASSEPFYKDFPQEVMEKSEAELMFHSLMYYTYSQDNDPVNAKIAQQIRELLTVENASMAELLPESDFNELKVIDTAMSGELENVLYHRTQALNMSLEMEEDFTLYARNHPDWIEKVFYQKELSIPSHETRAKLALIAHKQQDMLSLHKLCPNAEDVLRYACLLTKESHPEKDYLNANLDFNIKNKKKLFQFSKSEQREIKMLLNNCTDLYESIWHRKDLFQKLKERINANDSRYPHVKSAFDNLSKGIKQNQFQQPIMNLNPNLVRNEIKSGNMDVIHEYAAKNPKMFIRSLVSIAELAEKQENFRLTDFKKDIEYAADKIPVVQTLQLINYLKNTADKTERPYNVSEAKGKTFVVENNMHLSNIMRNEMIDLLKDVLNEKSRVFHEKEFQGKTVYIDKELENMKAPLRSIRNASKGQTLTPFSKIKGREDKNIAAFGIFWKNKDNERADIDLSVKLLDKDGNSVDEIYYGSLKGRKEIGVHSGDFTSGKIAPEINGAEEFVFLDKDLMKENNVRYAVALVYGFNVPFCDADSVRMIVEEKSGTLKDVHGKEQGKNNAPRFKGELMDPKEMHYSYRLTQNATVASSFIFDVETNEFISLDSTRELGLMQNVAGEKSSEMINVDVYKAFHNDVPSMYELFTASLENSGCVITNDIKEADVIFSSKAIDIAKEGCEKQPHVITAFELDEISSKFCDPHIKTENELLKQEITQEKDLLTAEEISESNELLKNDPYQYCDCKETDVNIDFDISD